MSVSIEDFKSKINEVGDNLYTSHFHLKIHEKMTTRSKLSFKGVSTLLGCSHIFFFD